MVSSCAIRIICSGGRRRSSSGRVRRSLETIPAVPIIRGIRMMRVLENNLKSAAQGQTRTLTVIQPEGKHSLQSWASRFPEAIQFLYGPARP